MVPMALEPGKPIVEYCLTTLGLVTSIFDVSIPDPKIFDAFVSHTFSSQIAKSKFQTP